MSIYISVSQVLPAALPGRGDDMHELGHSQQKGNPSILLFLQDMRINTRFA
jgi:hypothetical protein